MDPEGKTSAKFYLTFKIHKEHTYGETPPERQICSKSGTMLKNACTFVDHYIKGKESLHQTYSKDTPDFLRYID